MKKFVWIIFFLVSNFSIGQTVIQNDVAMERLINKNVEFQTLAEGLQFTEGPVWNAGENALLFRRVQYSG